MAASSSPRSVVRRLLARDRLERAEQTARQADALVATLQARVEQCEHDLRAIRGELDGLAAGFARLEAVVHEADPVQASQTLNAARFDVERLIAQVSDLVANRASMPPSTHDHG